MMKVEMQIADQYGRQINAKNSNKASDMIVQGMYICPSVESDRDDDGSVSQLEPTFISKGLDVDYERRPENKKARAIFEQKF